MDTATNHSVALERTADGWLTEATVARIEATYPRCAECGEPAYLVHYVVIETHRINYEIDNHAGEVNVTTQHEDTLTREPDEDAKTGGVWVECENGHMWSEARLKRTRASFFRYTVDDWELASLAEPTGESRAA